MDSHRTAKDEAILTSVAESIGATLGTIAAKAGSVQKALTEKVAGAKPRVRRAAKAAKAVVKKRAKNMRGARARKTRASGRAARRSRKKS
jgi:hypothetical protein